MTSPLDEGLPPTVRALRAAPKELLTSEEPVVSLGASDGGSMGKTGELARLELRRLIANDAVISGMLPARQIVRVQRVSRVVDFVLSKKNPFSFLFRNTVPKIGDAFDLGGGGMVSKSRGVIQEVGANYDDLRIVSVATADSPGKTFASVRLIRRWVSGVSGWFSKIMGKRATAFLCYFVLPLVFLDLYVGHLVFEFMRWVGVGIAGSGAFMVPGILLNLFLSIVVMICFALLIGKALGFLYDCCRYVTALTDAESVSSIVCDLVVNLGFSQDLVAKVIAGEMEIEDLMEIRAKEYAASLQELQEIQGKR